ncbi:hypothetical protein Y1Q_0024629 [Alligator mississippiensis]|uniref:Uncharacterized protein n=1 Tax=Alligator mississippiensis TaxID=8496 RepID=A0A151NB61_ALLMI|nr:hypothetical protein Y1Q_0024629 [Alligator mississippiensis]
MPSWKGQMASLQASLSLWAAHVQFLCSFVEVGELWEVIQHQSSVSTHGEQKTSFLTNLSWKIENNII